MNWKTVDRSFQPLYGLPCWGVRHERALNLSMNFGEPSLHVREPFDTDSASETVRRMAAHRRVRVRGQWWLWVYCCHWRLTSGEAALATGSSSRQQIDQAIAQLDGQKLFSVTVQPETGATRFAFDLGGALHCRRFERDDGAELWMLYKPSGYVLSAHGNGTLRHQRATGVQTGPEHADGAVRPDE